jgi:hypothetical protein
MSISFVNRTNHLVIVPLNTGETIHLSPRETTRPLEEYEAGGAAQKLLDRGQIARAEGSEAPAPPRAASVDVPRTRPPSQENRP